MRPYAELLHPMPNFYTHKIAPHKLGLGCPTVYKIDHRLVLLKIYLGVTLLFSAINIQTVLDVILKEENSLKVILIMVISEDPNNGLCSPYPKEAQQLLYGC